MVLVDFTIHNEVDPFLLLAANGRGRAREEQKQNQSPRDAAHIYGCS
jgi:hypothetical protein